MTVISPLCPTLEASWSCCISEGCREIAPCHLSGLWWQRFHHLQSIKNRRVREEVKSGIGELKGRKGRDEQGEEDF